MRRSVLLRFLGLSLAVALGAVIATAVIATYSTSEKLQGEIAEKGNVYLDKQWPKLDSIKKATIVKDEVMKSP